MVANSTEAKRALGGGAAAGAIGGAVLAVFMTIMALVRGMDVWSTTFKGAAAPFIGDAATQPGFDAGPVLLGTAMHFVVSIGWGIGFGLLFYGLSRGATLLASLVWGLVVWIGMFWVVLPLAGLSEMAAAAPKSTGILYHLVFGLAVGLGFLPFQRRHPALGDDRRHHGHHVPV
jgi:hypothetical protein